MQKMMVQDDKEEELEDEQVSEHESDEEDVSGACPGAAVPLPQPMEIEAPARQPLRGSAIRGIKAGGVKPTTTTTTAAAAAAAAGTSPARSHQPPQQGVGAGTGPRLVLGAPGRGPASTPSVAMDTDQPTSVKGGSSAAGERGVRMGSPASRGRGGLSVSWGESPLREVGGSGVGRAPAEAAPVAGVSELETRRLQFVEVSGSSVIDMIHPVWIWFYTVVLFHHCVTCAGDGGAVSFRQGLGVC